MKKFLIKGILFILVFVVFTYILQSLLILSIRTIKVGEFGVLNKIKKGEINADILISGSSRSLKGINPEVFEKETGLSCYNISSDGVSLEIQVPKLKMYLNNNKAPKVIIQDVDILGGFTLNNIYEPYKYLPYISDKDLLNGLKKIDEDFWLHEYIHITNIPYYNFDFYTILISDLQNSIKGKDLYKKGFYPDNSKWSTSIEQLKINRPDGINVSISKEYDNYLEELIRICNSHKIKLILVSLPYYNEIFSIVNKKADTDKYFQNKSQQDEVYFLNFSHLNSKGADTFSMYLAKKIKELLLKPVLISKSAAKEENFYGSANN
jgi:hypothetical protein